MTNRRRINRGKYEENVFVNCPFDERYKKLMFPAIVFTIHDCGFRPRCALERPPPAPNRLERILEIIETSKFGIHDLSRIGLAAKTRLPRFNMPFELGVFLGAQRFGNRLQKSKDFIVMDKYVLRYLTYISDLRGHDFEVHHGRVPDVIRIIRDWLVHQDSVHLKIGDKTILERYRKFRLVYRKLARQKGIDPNEIGFEDLSLLITQWMRDHPKQDN